MSIYSLIKLELRRLLKSRCLSATLGASALFFSACDSSLFAQLSNVGSGKNGETGASSILVNNQYRDGAISSLNRSNSRFSSGAQFGAVGNIMGLDGSGATRFSSGVSRFRSGESAQFRSQRDFSALRERAERLRAEAEAETANVAGADNSPRLVTATKPERFPYSRGRQARYGLRQDELAEKNRRRLEKQEPEGNAQVPNEEYFREYPEPQNAVSPQQIWMRGRQPNLGGVRTEVERWGDDYQGIYPDDVRNEPLVEFFGGRPLQENRLGGSFDLNDNLFETSAPDQAPVVQTPSPEETRQAFQGYLEEQLLRSPSVNPLSPIQVNFRDGTAVIRGVVPTPSARVAAGNILLADPRVQKVDNKLTFVRPDDPGLTPAAQQATSQQAASQQATAPNQEKGASN